MKRRDFIGLGLISTFSWLTGGCRPSLPSIKSRVIDRSQPDSPALPASPRFVDVAAEAGLDYRWVIPGPRPLNILQTIGNGCAFLDFDNDGNLDILLVGSSLALYRGDGKGHFQNVTRQTGLDKLHGHFLGCAVGDYDNDGYVDIYLTAYRGGALLHNEGGSHFREVTAQSGIAPQPWGTSAAWVPLTNDGLLDLFIGNYVEFGPHTDPQLCNNAGKMTACGPRFYNPIKGVLYKNRGNGRFENVSKAWGLDALHGKDLGVACADFDGSGRQSISVANDEVEGDLLQNLGGHFKNIGAVSGTAYNADGNVHGGMGTDWGDYDNDGRLDLVVATFQHETKCIYHNDGGGLFTESSAQLGMADIGLPYVSFGTKFFDYDNDGWLDLIIVSGHVQDNIADIDKSTTYRQPSLLLRNQNGTRFIDVTSQAGPDLLKPIVGRGLAIGDYDNDGRLDVLAVDAEGAPLLLHNETPAVGNWVQCRLQGTRSNRDGLGALVWVKTEEGKRYLRLCQTDGSYMSASDKRVHCGVGTAKVVDIEVHWPSGQIDVHKQIPTNHTVTLVEGSSQAKLV
ncbi:hypothetical protein CTKA_02533 [Chthonomonas calidirosea]|uniref:ASPIC and UnbV./Family description n=1 Tax=Chthonomonas calidirosea (strain DSM 23976 / ICMP 18418 / T49) TaxID=1303518 RepID=S0EYH1_CHTCT|nr:CRTAC1 family protein [Chthonomonas calidirosea]CCW35383.1 ASPIC and UnbV./Family description [Chthonomonas calidirosea T49]CEK20438.1 hypothetical protein CTKA_02533 [Chthonomonas calidirosea]